MTWSNILGISIGLAMDAFAVSIAAGLSLAPVTRRQVFRLAFHFGLFQFLMPVVGWTVGREVASHAQDFDHWIAFGLLAAIGGKMLRESGDDKALRNRTDPSRGWNLVLLSVATSIDALAVGLSLAFLRVSVWLPCITIGLVTAALCTLGIVFSSRIGGKWRRWAPFAGGCVLILIGTRILVSHLAN